MAAAPVLAPDPHDDLVPRSIFLQSVAKAENAECQRPRRERRSTAGVQRYCTEVGEFSGEDGHDSWPSVATIAGRVGRHPSTVRRWKHRAGALGVISWEAEHYEHDEHGDRIKDEHGRPKRFPGWQPGQDRASDRLHLRPTHPVAVQHVRDRLDDRRRSADRKAAEREAAKLRRQAQRHPDTVMGMVAATFVPPAERRLPSGACPECDAPGLAHWPGCSRLVKADEASRAPPRPTG